MSLSLTLTGAEVLRSEGLSLAPLSFSDGVISDVAGAKQVDLSGYLVLPGIIDAHGDGFERHLAPRRGAMTDMQGGLFSVEAEIAANGVTTACLAQFFSWEGGLRGADFAENMLSALTSVQDRLICDLRAQLRLEIHMLDDYGRFEDLVTRFAVPYVVFNDHMAHDRLSQGRRPKQLTGTALKSGRSPEALFELLLELHGRKGEVPDAVTGLATRLSRHGVRLGSHDDRTAADRAAWAARGAVIAEFPETVEAAQAARDQGAGIVMGAPNVMRGASHKGNIPATDLWRLGLLDALASDYHYASLWRAALLLAGDDLADLPAAWSLVSDGPARVLGLSDRGRLDPGLRADMVVLNRDTGRISATIAGGQVAHMAGDVAARFFAA